MNTPGDMEQALIRLSTFVAEKALPMWASSGHDGAGACFHERLRYSGEPIIDIPQRLMVQARQIVVYARASLSGWCANGHELALAAFASACRRYRLAGDGPGWIFSVWPDGRPADRTRDLYTHAFVLYMLAWVYRLSGDVSVLALADDTMSDIKQIFSSGEHAGYVSRVPSPGNVREQNPHMHLFEAFLALADASGKECYLDQARELVTLFEQILVDPLSGTVREVFDAIWRPNEPVGRNLVEPGHQMEWAWLLREWERLSSCSVEDKIGRLVAHAVRYGVDPQKAFVRSVVREDGSIVSCNSRIWPQTETIRTLSREDINGERFPGLITAVVDGLFRAHLPAHLNGGWVDLVDHLGEPAVDYMPASTLYHIAGAAMDCDAWLKRSRAAAC